MEKLKLDSTTASNRKPWSWTPQNEARAADIMVVFKNMQKYLPITERALFYQLIPVSGEHWERGGKHKGEQVDVYQALGRTLKWMRIDDMIPGNWIKDTHRTLTVKQGWDDMEDFVSDKLDFSFFGYNRCVAQDQPRYIEIWVEKDAVLDRVKPVADKFCRRVMVCRGYNSITFQASFYHRAKAAQKQGQIPTVLYFGDWDPSGVNMIYAAMQTIQKELGLDDVEYIRCGINPEHFAKIKNAPVPLKKSDKRARKFIANHGATAYELDAFHPEDLMKLVKDAIEHFTDMEILEANKQIEEKETDRALEMDYLLEETKEQVLTLAGAR
jgi:hypothetical protein